LEVSIRTCSATRAPVVRPFAARRLLLATHRLEHRLREVEVDVSRETSREGGRYVCRVQGRLAQGGTILVKRDDKDVHAAVASSFERFRRSLARVADRR
jgi:ribosome-associated translation inhibitor RaiA